ncbi:MAG TPA: MFS transporter, partial [Gemmataceae bacterium]|nr:MFS transporter [Gemmataceae bacterium]
PTLALFTTTRALNLSDKYNFLLFAYVGLVLAVAQGGLYRPLAKRVREVAFLIAGSLLLIGGMAGLGLVAGLAEQPTANRGFVLAWLLIALAVAVTGFAFITPSLQALISRLSDPARQGAVLGVNQSASAMGRILGPAVGVPLYFLTPTHSGPYLLAVVVFAVVLLLCVIIRRIQPAEAK